METLLYVFGTVAVIMFFFVIYWLFCKWINNKTFQLEMAVGDFCQYFDEEDRIDCIIQNIEGRRVTVKNIFDELKIVDKSELYI